MRPPNVVPAFETVTRVAPILRGLLAWPSGDDDHPYQPVILSSHTDPAALAFAATCQRLPLFLDTVRTAPLRLESLRGDEPDEELRTHLAKALAGYQAAHQANPEIIALPGVAVFQVSNPAPAPGHDRRLAGRVAVVTGAAGAIGYGICMGLLEHGAHVAITDLPGDKLDLFVAEFQERDAARTIGVPMDVTEPASVARAFAQIIAHWGGVDIVVLNAGIALACPLVETDLEAFRRLERVNVEGTLLVLAEAAETVGAGCVVAKSWLWSPGPSWQSKQPIWVPRQKVRVAVPLSKLWVKVGRSACDRDRTVPVRSAPWQDLHALPELPA